MSRSTVPAPIQMRLPADSESAFAWSSLVRPITMKMTGQAARRRSDSAMCIVSRRKTTPSATTKRPTISRGVILERTLPFTGRLLRFGDGDGRTHEGAPHHAEADRHEEQRPGIMVRKAEPLETDREEVQAEHHHAGAGTLG